MFPHFYSFGYGKSGCDFSLMAFLGSKTSLHLPAFLRVNKILIKWIKTSIPLISNKEQDLNLQALVLLCVFFNTELFFQVIVIQNMPKRNNSKSPYNN